MKLLLSKILIHHITSCLIDNLIIPYATYSSISFDEWINNPQNIKYKEMLKDDNRMAWYEQVRDNYNTRDYFFSRYNLVTNVTIRLGDVKEIFDVYSLRSISLLRSEGSLSIYGLSSPSEISPGSAKPSEQSSGPAKPSEQITLYGTAKPSEKSSGPAKPLEHNSKIASPLEQSSEPHEFTKLSETFCYMIVGLKSTYAFLVIRECTESKKYKIHNLIEAQTIEKLLVHKSLRKHIWGSKIKLIDSDNLGFLPFNEEKKNYCLRLIAKESMERRIIPRKLVELINEFYYFQQLCHGDYFIAKLKDGRWIEYNGMHEEVNITHCLTAAISEYFDRNNFIVAQTDMLINASVCSY